MWSGTIPFTVSRTPNPALTGYTTSCGVKGFNMPESPNPAHNPSHFVPFQLPSGFRRPVEERFSFNPVRKTQAGAV
ncbi:hypothetical protein SAMN05216525_12495 [Bradyrhizobium sp. Gha]|nr:hypothetical protein SAMN05216525_12495 [Bradyrhizobium sp. Gha]